MMIRNPYRQLEKDLGYRFSRRKRLVSALTHRSFRFENDPDQADNQRLEYLGDAAIGLVAAHYFYDKFPDTQEGGLTRMRSRITSTKALAAFAARINLGTYLKLGKGEMMSGGNDRVSNLTDAMEAVLGAAYLDGGIKAVQKIFKKVFVPVLQQDTTPHQYDNPKGALQELSQGQWRMSPYYRVLSEEGPPHARQFRVEVIVNGRALGVGDGPNKRAAEMAAAEVALQAMREKSIENRESPGGGVL
ncbi:MAG: ribonuclease III [bacterium]